MYTRRCLVLELIAAGLLLAQGSQPAVQVTGDVKQAVSRFEPHYAEKLSLAGTPEEVVAKIKTDLEPAGVNHMIFSLADPALVKLFSGEDVPNVPDINGQLRLVAERVMPAFG